MRGRKAEHPKMEGQLLHQFKEMEVSFSIFFQFIFFILKKNIYIYRIYKIKLQNTTKILYH